MSKSEFVLHIFSLFPDAAISPMQAQNLFFLIEKRLGDRCGEQVKVFNFEPYCYGPFDKDLFQSIKEYSTQGILSSHRINNVVYHKIKRSKVIDTSEFLNPEIRKYIKDELVEFVRRIRFRELCFSIYKEFPDMAKNSILLSK
jgi:hypothetical protein